MRLPVNHLLPLAALVLLGGCLGTGHHAARHVAPPPATGPAADYPMIVGDPFTIDGTTYTPVDTLNYDAVGYAAVGEDGGGKVSGAHKTMPLPSYVEVTSLDTGKTILVRLDKRGPMRNDILVELSPGAAAQLGVSGHAPVRVRRVNPPEQERAMLRAGQPAPDRMETPKALVAVLTRRLQDQKPLMPALAAAPAAEPAQTAQAASKPAPVKPAAAKATDQKPAPAPSPDAPAKPVTAPETASRSLPTADASPKTAGETGHAAGSLMVQVAAFSTQDRADRAAASLSGATIDHPGRFWLMRLGPFASASEAQAALAKAKGAGYSDARIQRVN